MNPRLVIQGKGIGTSTRAIMVAHEFTRPKGHWKQFWTRHLLNIGAGSRLPRGFNSKLVAEVSIRIDDEAKVSSSWFERERSTIVSAVSKLAPAEPVKKSVRRKAKPPAPAE